MPFIVLNNQAVSPWVEYNLTPKAIRTLLWGYANEDDGAGWQLMEQLAAMGVMWYTQD